MLWSVDSCQNSVSADQYRLTVSRAQVSTHWVRAIFWNYPLTSYYFSNGSALVNIRRKALLSSVGFRKRMTSRSPRSFHMWFICTSIVYIWLVRFLVRDFVPLFRSFLDWFQSIQTRRCHCLRLKDVLMFQASSYSAGKRTFQWMFILNNIRWMAPDHQAVYLGEIIHYHFPYWIHIQCKNRHTYIPHLRRRINVVILLSLYCVILPYEIKRMRKIWGGNNNII